MPAGIVKAKPEADHFDLAVIGGGAAGYFLAITAAGLSPGLKICIMESDAQVLRKVRISGGGRCNVTNACEDPEVLARFYPRGGKLLRKAFHSFGPREMKAWLEDHGVSLKTEPDGRVFPVSDDSQTIIDCFQRIAATLGVKVFCQTPVTGVSPDLDGWQVQSPAREVFARNLAIATGGNPSHFSILNALGHTIIPLVPSLFTFRSSATWMNGLAGISVPNVKLMLDGTQISSEGALLFTHQGISGPAVLRLSAWGAREFAEREYHGTILANFSNGYPPGHWVAENRAAQGRKIISNTPFPGIPARLWDRLLSLIPGFTNPRWAETNAATSNAILSLLNGVPIPVHGKNTFKEEFVSCGGVSLAEVRHQSMESRLHPGLYFAGEVLDIDAVTGGFNFQAAWTTAWLAGSAIAAGRRSG